MRPNQASSSGGSHWAWIGRSTAALTAARSRQEWRRHGPARRRAGGHHHVLDAVELDGGPGDSAELRRCLALDRAAGRQRLADGAELAGLGPALIADAGLQDGGGEHVAAVQDGDLRIGNAVRGRAGS